MVRFGCSLCGKNFRSPQAALHHGRDKHNQTVTAVRREEPKREESFASRAIDAALYRAMGLPTDDEWLLP